MDDSFQQDEISQVHAKVLIIDDSDSARALLKRRLSIYGYEVYAVPSRDAAIENLKLQEIDVIFLNMIIDSTSSYNFLLKLKEDDVYKNIPVIMISSDDDVELVVKCIEAGAEDYLVRPLNQTILKARLANCISKKVAHDREVLFLKKIAQGQKQIVKQEKMASLGMLVSSVSRELKNPLNFVINFAQVSYDQCAEIKQEIDKNKDKIETNTYNYLINYIEKFSCNVQKITEYGRNADRIIRFMLDQATVSGGQKTPADLNKVIQQTITMLFSLYKSNGITRIPKIETNLDNNIGHLQISIQSINRAIHNILDNAVYAVLHKHKNLEDCHISITTQDVGDNIRIVIRDNGGGIPPENMDKLFLPFFTTKSDGSGPGLGLYSAKEVITNHAGTISVRSDDGIHSEFEIILKK